VRAAKLARRRVVEGGTKAILMGTAVNQVVVTEDAAVPAVAFHLRVIC
jgi:hypothetical protein